MTDEFRHGFLFHCRFILEDGRHFFLDALLPDRPVEVQDATVTFCQGPDRAVLEDIGVPPASFPEQRGTGVVTEWLTKERFFGYLGPKSPPIPNPFLAKETAEASK